MSYLMWYQKAIVEWHKTQPAIKVWNKMLIDMREGLRHVLHALMAELKIF